MKNKISIILRVLVLAALVAFEALVCFCILRLDMLPTLYEVALIGLFLLIAIGVGALLLVHKKGKKVSLVRMILATVLALVLMAGCLLGAHMTSKFYDTMVQITNTPKPNSERNVYVLVDDLAQTIADAASYTFGTVAGYDENCTQQVLDAINAELGVSVNVQAFESVPAMLDALYEKQIGAVILNGGYLSILEDDSRYVSFSEETRVLYTVPVIEEGKVEAPVIEPDTTANITNTPFVLYLSGQDGYAENLVVTRSDVNILMVVNPNTKQILMVNTPRDYYVVHPWGSGARDKLTHCGIYGIDCSIQALENLYGIEINHYAQINFNGFKALIDGIGGITVYSDNAFIGDEQVQIVAGENFMDGQKALHFARDRYHQPGGDNGRGQNQMKVIRAVINKVTSGSTFIKKYATIFDSLDGMFATSVTIEDMGRLAKMQLADMAQWNVQTYAVTGFGDSQKTYSMPSLYAYVMQPNEKAVKYGSELINRVLSGEVLTAEDMKLPE